MATQSRERSDRQPDGRPPEPAAGAAQDSIQALETPEAKAEVARQVERVRHPDNVVRTLVYFWQKVNNDWVLNLAGLLAYNFLLSIFPILLLALAAVGFLLQTLSLGSQSALQAAIGAALPDNVGSTVIGAISAHLRKSAGLVLILGIAGSLIGGSRLFITIESCLSVVFRLRQRDPIRQNVMAFGMLLLYLALLPIIVLASTVPSAIVQALPFEAPKTISNGFIQVAGLVVGFLAAVALFGAIYVFVPNQSFRWRAVWRGSVVAAALLVLYEQLFPLYATLFLHADNYGTVAGFALVVLVFFYYLAFILLLGAEINSWSVGQRQTAADIPGVLHEVQAHATTLGAAGPTAGLPQEDVQSHLGAVAMETPERAVRHERRAHGFKLPRPLVARWVARQLQLARRFGRREG